MSPGGFPSQGGLFAPLSPLLAQIFFAPEFASLERLSLAQAVQTQSGLRMPMRAPCFRCR